MKVSLSATPVVLASLAKVTRTARNIERLARRQGQILAISAISQNMDFYIGLTMKTCS